MTSLEPWEMICIYVAMLRLLRITRYTSTVVYLTGTNYNLEQLLLLFGYSESYFCVY